MKTLIVPVSSALLSTTLCVYGSHLCGMPKGDLIIVAIVAGGVAITTAVCAGLLAMKRSQTP